MKRLAREAAQAVENERMIEMLYLYEIRPQHADDWYDKVLRRPLTRERLLLLEALL